MSAEDSEDPSVPRKVLRTVTPPFRGRPDREMTLVGTAYFLGLLILLVPLLPFIVIVWLISKLIDAIGARRAGGE